jgi:hypothetical protein
MKTSEKTRRRIMKAAVEAYDMGHKIGNDRANDNFHYGLICGFVISFGIFMIGYVLAFIFFRV